MQREYRARGSGEGFQTYLELDGAACSQGASRRRVQCGAYNGENRREIWIRCTVTLSPIRPQGRDSLEHPCTPKITCAEYREAHREGKGGEGCPIGLVVSWSRVLFKFSMVRVTYETLSLVSIRPRLERNTTSRCSARER
jgi:hypothetical protein